MSEQKKSRREFLKKVAYAAPAIMTVKAAPAFARLGSLRGDLGTHDFEEHLRLARKKVATKKRAAKKKVAKKRAAKKKAAKKKAVRRS